MTEKLTTNAGQPWADNEHSQTAGARGPVLIQDYQLLEKLAHFDRERIPERVVHAKGASAKGVFTLENDMSEYTKADLFNGAVGKQTPLRVRFSQVAGEAGYPDTYRDVRGFAVKFYTEDGNYDIVGNNTPVFFINDPLKFPDFIHSQKRDPRTHARSAEMQWDFWAHSPEATHQVTILMGDRGLPATYRNMEGYGSHTFKWVNADNKPVWVKYHFVTNQGVKNMSNELAAKLSSEDTDFLQNDLYNSIADGDFPSWTLYVQIIPYEEGLNYKYDLFDVTKVVSKKDYPLIKVGTMELNENPENNFDEVEELAFSPANLVPGIEASPDKVLQGRLFSYKDAQRYRLGANFETIPVNRPLTEVHNYERDGAMSQYQDGSGNYEPNGFDGPQEDHCAKINGDELTGKTGDFKAYDTDYFSQAGDLYRLMSEEERTRLVGNIVSGLKEAGKEDIQVLATRSFYKADPEYGTRIADGLGLSIDKIK